MQTTVIQIGNPLDMRGARLMEALKVGLLQFPNGSSVVYLYNDRGEVRAARASGNPGPTFPESQDYSCETRPLEEVEIFGISSHWIREYQWEEAASELPTEPLRRIGR